MRYREFLESKIRLAIAGGFEVDLAEINPKLKPHQRDIVRWALRGGNRAIFAAFGLGKTWIQIEILRLILKYAGGRALIICPLGVRLEFLGTGPTLGVDFRFIRRSEEITEDHAFYLTNYESVRDGKLDPNLFTAVSLDEASVLRSFGSKTYQEFLKLFGKVRYKFVNTATPSPNRFKELIHYAGFLGIMDTGQCLTRFFQRDSTQANNLTLYPHKEREFWLWMNSWAVFLQKPSDLGHSDTDYNLPELKVVYHEVATDHSKAGTDKDGQVRMFSNAAIGLSEAASEKRSNLPERLTKMQEILAAAPDDHFIVWHALEDERRAIQEAVPSAVSVYGTQDMDEREQAIVNFGDGEFQYLSTKEEIAGSGCNFQRHCHKAIFFGITYKFNDFIQAIHRIYRFGQVHTCEIHIIFSEAEREILTTLRAKWVQHNQMVQNMTGVIKEFGLNDLSMRDVLARTIGVERLEVSGERFCVANNDCVQEAMGMAENSMDMILTSVPFSNHYEYTPSYNDFGHNEDNERFFAQMDFLSPELLRILKPGRVAAIHVKDRVIYGNVTGLGMSAVDPFHAECIHHYRKHGFIFMGMITVVTDVVRENNQTYRLGWSEQCKDSSKMGVGCPEYVLLFRKQQTDTAKAYADERVSKEKPRCLDDDGMEGPFHPKAHPIPGTGYSRSRWQVDAHAFWRSSGERLLTAEEMAGYGPGKLAKIYTTYSLENLYDYEFHVKIGEELDVKGALPSTFMSLAPGSHHPEVWHDVNRMLTLNGKQEQKGLQHHVCPLQFDIIDRLITRYTNKDEVVFDPFGGLLSTPYRAIKLGRRGRASELSAGYFFDGVQYLKAAELEASMPTLFSFEEEEVSA